MLRAVAGAEASAAGLDEASLLSRPTTSLWPARRERMDFMLAAAAPAAPLQVSKGPAALHTCRILSLGLKDTA